MKKLVVTIALAVNLILLSQLTSLAFAKDPPPQVLVWPSTGSPVIRFSFGRFKEVSGGFSNLHSYLIDTTAENLSAKVLNNAVFNLYLFDKAKVRIGEGWISLNNVGPGQAVRFETSIHSSGNPASLDIVPRTLPDGFGPPQPPKTISITVNSVPQGATLKVDGQPSGETPKAVQLGLGKHMLEFNKEGFNPGHFPVEVTASDVSGGSVSYELGASAHDTIELRDGNMLTGDLESVSAAEVVFRIAGALQHIDRNKVKRISMVERDAPSP